MSSLQKTHQVFIDEETRMLFYQRTLICLWLAVVFFPLFSLLDYVYRRDLFTTFLLYRLLYVIVLFMFINLLKLPSIKKFAPLLMYAAMVLGGFVISLMTVHQGGFESGYYVGILLMIAGALSVLPLTTSQALLYGLSMYAVYVLTVILGNGVPDSAQLISAASNSFFFLTIVGIAAIQSFDDLRTLRRQLRAKLSIRDIGAELAAFTDGLEAIVQQRLTQLQETDLRYRDLYNSITDMVVLIDADGAIRECNSNWTDATGLATADLQRIDIRTFLRHEREKTDWLGHVQLHLAGDDLVRGMQLTLTDKSGRSLEVELSASKVAIDGVIYYQLILRDISATKSIERKLLDAERLIGASRQAAIFGLARLAECRDDETGAHLSRIRSYTRILAEEMAQSQDYAPILTEEFIEEIGHSAVLHDIGKVGIPDFILQKPGRLTADEYEVMKQHTVFGAHVLAAAGSDRENPSFLQLGSEIARSHHERWDSRGYPDGLPGSEIPLAARIISLADVYDALTSSRVYKPPFSHEESRSIIVEESGRQFDPNVVNAFLRREEEFRETRMRLLLQQPEASEYAP